MDQLSSHPLKALNHWLFRNNLYVSRRRFALYLCYLNSRHADWLLYPLTMWALYQTPLHIMWWLRRKPLLEEISMTIGTVKFFNSSKGYGFIEPEDGSKDAFVHISAVERAGLSTLNDGQKVSYELQPGRDGKASAEDLKLADWSFDICLWKGSPLRRALLFRSDLPMVLLMGSSRL